ncbi:actin-related protein 2/3 complex subunit 5 family protein [Helicobacter pylori]|nr:actin-related protein 2/3 complex subunit 5 family protein [Helicobacter pylori]
MENDVKEDLEQARPKQELEKLTQEKEQEIKKKEERKYINIFSEIIKEERKYIYIIIIFLFMLYPILSSIPYNEPSQAIKTAHTKTILEILPDPISDLIKNNLDSHQQEISDLLSSSKDKMYSKVDAQIDNLFDPIENNVDKFLDWHYSLKGNYSELALFVAKKLGLSVEDALFNKLQEKFLGADYKQRLKTMTDNISDAFISLLRQHKKDTEKIAIQGVADIPQVVESLKNIDDRTERDLKLKMGFAAAIGATAGVGAGKLMKRLVPKLVEKLGTKLGAKFLAKFGIAVGGVLPTLGADVAFNYIDEWLHRDDFKKEILNNINEMKKNLKESYKTGFDNSITKFSQEFQKDLKNIETISVKAYVEKLK